MHIKHIVIVQLFNNAGRVPRSSCFDRVRVRPRIKIRAKTSVTVKIRVRVSDITQFNLI